MSRRDASLVLVVRPRGALHAEPAWARALAAFVESQRAAALERVRERLQQQLRRCTSWVQVADAQRCVLSRRVSSAEWARLYWRMVRTYARLYVRARARAHKTLR